MKAVLEFINSALANFGFLKNEKERKNEYEL